MSSSLSTCFSGRIRNWVNTATDIKSITTLHMLWKSKEFIRQLLMASSLNFIWKTFLDCDWAQKFKTIWVREGSVQFSRSVMSNSATPWTSAYQIPLSITNSRSSLKLTSLSWWCHPTISSSVIPFFSCPQSFPASGFFPISQLFTWGCQSIGVSASTSVLPMNTQDWFPLRWTGWISLQSKGLLRVFSNTTVQKHQFFSAQLSSQSNSHIHTGPLGKP